MDKTSISVKTTKYRLQAGVDAIKNILSRADEIGVDPSDIGLLMSTMTTLAVAYDGIEGAKHINFDLELEESQAKALWHSLRMSLDNSFVSDQAKAANMMELQAVLAQELDKLAILSQPPGKLTLTE